MFSPARKTNKRYEAFTITEVVVASLLLVVAIVPILKALTAAHVLDVKVEHRTRSLVLAQAKLDEIRARSIYSWGTNFNDSSSSVDGVYLCKVADNSVPGRLNAIIRDIEVSVGYDDNNNSVLEDSEIEVTLRTLIARRDP